MRPINKGTDLDEFTPYVKAQQKLIERLGSYCSYCERWVSSSIHVEHKKPKQEYPELQFRWVNFLLSCGNCNSEKGHGYIELGNYVWPDTDNTLRAFIYDEEGRVKINPNVDPEITIKIKNTWIMLGFNKHPDLSVLDHQNPSEKDYRWSNRRDEWIKANRVKEKLLSNDTEVIRSLVIESAYPKGMFSIWYQVFMDDTDIKKRLIEVFIGTAKNCFDDDANLIPRQGGYL